jgi:hypothetical protein
MRAQSLCTDRPGQRAQGKTSLLPPVAASVSTPVELVLAGFR